MELTKSSPIGALSLFPVCLTAVCFPVAGVLAEAGYVGKVVGATIIVICGFLFTPALTCSVYSIFFERSKLFGFATLVVGGLTVYFERNTLYFVEMGLALVPCTVLVMMIISKRRNRNRMHANAAE